MNWVGGSRSRIILKQERRKQKEFFEKKKLRSKMKLLGVTSPPKSSTVSLDLLNLYVVNQISSKKDNAERVRKPVHVDMNRGLKTPIKRHNIELPMSPQRTSSNIGLDDIQNRIQKQILENRRKHLSDKVKYQPQLSQVIESTYTDSSLEYQNNQAADYNFYPVSASVSWASNYKQSPEQHFRRNLACSSWELADEEKQHKQQGNNICQDAWVSKSQNRQCIFSKSNTAMPLGTVFKKMNSPDYINSDSTSALITGKDSGSGNKIKEPLFGILQETAAPNDTYDESGHSLLTLSEDGRQLFHNSPSMEHCSTFVNHSRISQLFTDPEDMNEIANKCSPYNREIYNMTKCTEMYTVDRCLKGIFTGPEQTFFISKNISSGSHKENEQPNKGHLKEYHKGLYCLISSENQDNPSKFERTGAFTDHNHTITLEEKMQNYSTINNDNAPLEQPTYRCSQVFGFEKVLMAEEEQCDFEVSSKLGKMEKDIESSLSSRSPSYSPKQTDSCSYPSSEMSEEDEPAEKKCLSDSSFQMNSTTPLAASTSKGLQHSFCTESVLFPPCINVIMKEANTPEQKEPSLQAPEKENKDLAAQPQHNSSHIPFGRMTINCNGRSDAWSQTENPILRVEKLDAAIQCDIIHACCCRNNLSSVQSAEILTNASKAGNTGGQEIPADQAFRSSSTGNAKIIAEFYPEIECLTLPDKMTVDVLNYINILKKKEEQLSTKENN